MNSVHQRLLFALCGCVSLSALICLTGCGAGSPPPVASHFSIGTPATVTAGTPFNITVSALDASDRVVTSYSGTVHITSSDAQAVLPPNSPLANGTGTFSVTFKTPTGQTITATDAAAPSLSGISSSINVNPPPATHLSFSGPAAVTAGVVFNFTVTALDASNNRTSNYSGTVHFTSTDTKAILPADAPLPGGTQTFSATLNTIANTTVTATDTAFASINGNSGAIGVFSNAATHLLVATSGSATTRAPINTQVKALDGANNIAAGYTGTVHFTSTDAKAILPADAKLPNGIGDFSTTLETAGNQTITATDVATASLTGPSNAIVVTAAAALTISSGTPPSGTVNVNYAPNKNQPFRCTLRGGIVSCTPCPPASCTSLPVCRRFNPVYPCVQTESVFGGFTFAATGGIPHYSWTASALPPGLSLNAQNGELIGTPLLAGTYKAVVTVADSGTPQVTTPGNYTIVIANPPPPVVNSTPAPPAGVIKLPYSFTFTATGGLPPLGTWTEAGALPPGLQFTNSTSVLAGTPTAAGTSPITVMVQDAAGQNSAAQAFNIQIFAHGFSATGSMATARIAHTATLLNSGKVLVAGGNDQTGKPVATAELYDPSTGTFSSTGNMAAARAYFAAALLPSGKVLVTGGTDASGNPLSSAEIYDPSTGTFSATHGNMQFVHASHTATLLNTGKVLVAGWGNATAELFDPATGDFTATGSMVTARVGHTATLLNNGKVLVAGGIQGAPPATTVVADAELYDPTTGTFSQTTGILVTARYLHAASLLSDGKVLVTGGLDSTGKAIASAEVFDPTSQSFTLTKGSMAAARAHHTSTTLKDGTVLVTGGDNPSTAFATAEVYDPAAGTFSPTGSMASARTTHTATLLNDGRVLVTGGPGATAELYQ